MSRRTDAAQAITVTVTFFADLRRFLPRGADGPQRYTLSGNATIADLLALIGVAPDADVTAAVDGELADRETALHEGADVMLLSPMEGGGDVMERYGYWNKILHVNLTDRSTWIEEPGDAFFRRYAGGRGLIAHYLLKYVPKGADPLGPDNILVIAPGVLTGAPVPGAGRHSVGAKSPLTGGFGESESGGYWGAELKRAGWDAIVFHGVSPTPVYLWINEGAVEIRDAAHLWGKITGEVEDPILAELGDPRIRIAQIGPAGENLVRFACIANELNEVAGRTGHGRGHGLEAAQGHRRARQDPGEDRRSARAPGDRQVGLGHHGREAPGVSRVRDRRGHAGQEPRGRHARAQLSPGRRRHHRQGGRDRGARPGAREDGRLLRLLGALQEGRPHRGEGRGRARRLRERLQGAREGGVRSRSAATASIPRYGGPEYESLAALGVNLGLDDLIAICKSNEMCNYLAMDTVSLGCTLAWAMECFEKGILTLDDTGGVPLRFHDADGVIKLVEMIAYRQGIGDLLAEGSQRAAQRLGRGSEAFLTTVKGMEMAMHDPRHMPVMRASYLLAPTGGDHMRQTSNRNGLRNQIGLCHFLAYEDDQSLQILKTVTGWDITPEEMVTTAHRGLTLARLFNLREGMSRADDRLPARFSDPLPKHAGLTSRAAGQDRHRLLRRAGLGRADRRADGGDHPRARARGRRRPRRVVRRRVGCG